MPPATARCNAAQPVASLSFMRMPPVTPPPNAISEISSPVRPKMLFFMAARSSRRTFGPQLEALDLAGRGLRQVGAELDRPRIFVGDEPRYAVILQSEGERRA